MTYKELLKIVPTLQSASLLKENTKKKPKLVKQGIKNIFGIELIKLESNLIGGI